jgi:hypothetical protein
MLSMIKLLIAPRNLHRYVGRHRTRYVSRAGQPVPPVMSIEVTVE